MTVTIRQITSDDIDTLWLMLFYAAHVDEEDGKTVQDARNNLGLEKYVARWGRNGDLGFVALDEHSNQAVGAVWARLFVGDKAYSVTDDDTPELAIAILPDYIGQGIGTQLMQIFLDAAKKQFPAVALNVRADNAALRLYKRLGFEVVTEMTNRVGTLSYDMRITFD